jgi:hypothetical protein
MINSCGNNDVILVTVTGREVDSFSKVERRRSRIAHNFPLGEKAGDLAVTYFLSQTVPLPIQKTTYSKWSTYMAHVYI